jgi:hypothetical protein
MSQQILSPSGKSVWRIDEASFLEPSAGRKWISWNGFDWLQKFKDESDTEVIGYQLAEGLGLPVQPWLVVEAVALEETGIEKSNILILIQKWPLVRTTCRLDHPASAHSSLVGHALALATLGTAEWPCWMTNDSMTEIRLCDLEFFGPPIFFSHPLSLDPCVDAIWSNADDCYETACRAHVRKEFLSGVDKLIANLTDTVNFSGHSREQQLNTAVASFLNSARQLLSNWIVVKKEQR